MCHTHARKCSNPIGNSMCERQAAAFKANARAKNIAFDHTLDSKSELPRFNIGLSLQTIGHKHFKTRPSKRRRGNAGSSRQLILATRLPACLGLKIRSKRVAHACHEQMRRCMRDNGRIDHHQVGSPIEMQVLIKIAAIVVEHRKSAAWGIA